MHTTDTTTTTVNPLSRREYFSSRELILHRVTTLVTFIIFLITAIYYTFEAPGEGRYPRHTIWGNNAATPFTQNSIMTSIYWYVLSFLMFQKFH
jgi:hypothetical protein